METVISALGTLIVGIYLGFRIGFARGIRMNPRFPANPKPALSGWVLVGIGSLFFMISMCISLYTLYFTRTARSTTGTVIEMLGNRDKDSGATSYAPVFSYRDSIGSTQIVSSGFYSSPPEFRTGETVPVLYREGHAKSGRINSFWQLWGLPAILGIAGFVATSTGSIMLYWQRRKSRIPG